MKTLSPCFSLVLLGAGFALPGHANLIGETINIDRLIPSIGFDYNVDVGQSGAYTVGVSAPLSLSEGNNEYASATGTDLIVDFGPAAGSGGGYSDHEIVFSGLYAGTGTSIDGFTIVTNDVPGIIPSDVSFTPNSLTILIGDTNYPGGQVLDVSLQTSSVPEPSTLALLGTAIVLLGTLRFRQQRRRRLSFV